MRQWWSVPRCCNCNRRHVLASVCRTRWELWSLRSRRSCTMYYPGFHLHRRYGTKHETSTEWKIIRMFNKSRSYIIMFVVLFVFIHNTNFFHCLPCGPLLKNDTREFISLDCQDGRIIAQIGVVPLQSLHQRTVTVILFPVIDLDELHAVRENVFITRSI